MHTLEQLRSGELKGATRLKLVAELDSFPEDIFTLADSLEILDLSNNQLKSLPSDLHRLHKLKIIFCSNNRFESLPHCLGRCENLEMVGFKANQIQCVSSESLPEKLRWLILTDNKLEALPEELGDCYRLQKLMLAGNQLKHIPRSITKCSELQLIRIAANQLDVFPEHVFQLPKLAWLAFSGNPFCQKSQTQIEAKQFELSSIAVGEVLGQGASGVVSRASWAGEADEALPEQFAIKVFKGEVTSDGYPKDELDICLHMGEHTNLVSTFGYAEEANYASALMHLIPEDYKNLGGPPSFASCTRDTFDEELVLSLEDIESLTSQMESAVTYLHRHKIAHGDIYAHNVLISPDKHVLFGDFGAASDYAYLPEHIQENVERVERRALGYFLDDLLQHHARQPVHCDSSTEAALLEKLKARVSLLIR